MATLNAPNGWRPKLRGKCVPYFRASTLPHTRLDPKVQRAAIGDLIAGMPVRLLPAFTEAEPLIEGNRPELEKAIAECKDQNATLIFGRLDRMRRNVEWLQLIYSHGVRVAAADIPHFAHDEYMRLYNERHRWRLEMSERVSRALAEAKQRGVVLGGRRGNPENLKNGPAKSATARIQKALRRDYDTMRQVQLLRHRGITGLTDIAKRLNQMGHAAPRGGEWSPTQVSRVINRWEETKK